MKELSLNHREYKLCHYLRPWEENDKSATISFRIPVTLDGTTDDLLWASPWWTAVHLSPPQHRLHSGLASNDVLLYLPTPYQYRRIPRCAWAAKPGMAKLLIPESEACCSMLLVLPEVMSGMAKKISAECLQCTQLDKQNYEGGVHRSCNQAQESKRAQRTGTWASTGASGQ